MQVETNTKKIDCPAHPGKHQAELFCHPHSLAGIWGCPVTGESDSHDHTDTITEEYESWPTGPEDTTYTRQIEVCADCGVEVDD